MTTQPELVSRVISAIKEQMVDLAESAMMTPKADPFSHGNIVGTYQGLKQALDTIHAILRDDYDKELKS